MARLSTFAEGVGSGLAGLDMLRLGLGGASGLLTVFMVLTSPSTGPASGGGGGGLVGLCSSVFIGIPHEGDATAGCATAGCATAGCATAGCATAGCATAGCATAGCAIAGGATTGDTMIDGRAGNSVRYKRLFGQNRGKGKRARIGNGRKREGYFHATSKPNQLSPCA
jgi:hypothetical protein